MFRVGINRTRELTSIRRYTFDLCLPPGAGVRPQPLDGEVESFEVGT